jgi:hypothetical protein
MRVTRKFTFNQYWFDSEFNDKKPVRNGSKKMLAGDNIYYLDAKAEWHQAPSIHSEPDGSVNLLNLERDTKSSNVLLSTHFYYFGSAAVTLPDEILRDLGYKNGRNHRIFKHPLADPLIQWLEGEHQDSLSLVLGDPFDFDKADKSYSLKSNRMV